MVFFKKKKRDFLFFLTKSASGHVSYQEKKERVKNIIPSSFVKPTQLLMIKKKATEKKKKKKKKTQEITSSTNDFSKCNVS